jgi:tetratricopeptide (TPR) repeat protein
LPTFGEVITEARRLFTAGQFAPAEHLYRQLIAAVPQAADPWHELGLVQLKDDHLELAAQSVQKAIALDSDTAVYHSNLGGIYQKLDRSADALVCFERALHLAGPSPELSNNLGLALKGIGRKDAALAAFDDALKVRPDYVNALFGRGSLLMSMGRLDEATADLERAIALAPDDVDAQSSLGLAHLIAARIDAALECFQRGVALLPDRPECRLNRAVTWLLMNDYQQGWPEFESRLDCRDSRPRETDKPRWDGRRLDGKLLIHAEQGLGDTLQFIRYVALVEPLASTMIVEVQPALMKILQASGFGPWLAARGGDVEYDVHCPMASLPYTFFDAEPLPYWNKPYLAADERLSIAWADRLRAIDGFKVGIVWSGSTQYSLNHFRSVSIAEFAPLAAVPGVRLISLQKGTPSLQLDELPAGMQVIDWSDELDESAGAFMDTAAVIRNLDLVVTVDTSIAHLAGGMGAPVWMPLQLSPDWRWGLHGDETLWYPSMRLFRQRQLGDWTGVFAEMAASLGELAPAR